MNNKNKNNDFIDIKGIIKSYIRQWYWFVISVFICGIFAYVYVKTHPRENKICASILVVQDEGTTSMLNGLGGLLGADPYVQDEIFVITSHSVMKDVAQRLGLNKRHVVKTGFLTKKFEYPQWPVDVYCDPATLDTLSSVVQFKVNVKSGAKKADITVVSKGKKLAKLKNAELPAAFDTQYGTFIVNTVDSLVPKEGITSWVTISGYDGAAEGMAKFILADIASKKSNVIELSTTSTNADYGRDVLNTMMAVYNDLGIAERNQRATKTAKFIDDRLTLISQALNDAEHDIEKYKEGSQLVDVQTEATINTQLKTNYERLLVDLQTKKEILEMSYKFLSNEANRYELMPMTSLGGDEKALAPVDTYNELILRRMTMMSGAKPNNRQIQDLEKQLDAMRANILVALEQYIGNTDVAISEARSQANLAMSKLGNIPTQEREYINLKRQQEVKQQLYLFLLQRSEETAMLIANAIPKGQIIDKAYVLRDPVGTSKKNVLLIAIFIGLFIPVVVIYVVNLLRSRMNGRSDVEKITGLPILGEMCVDKSGQKLVVSENATTSSAELFRMMRTNLQFVLNGREDKVVMITSSQSGEGKSFISTNLAASLALLGRRVILIGMDIRKPQLANYLGISPTPGLTQYLSEPDMSVDDIVRDYSEVPGLDVIVAGPIPPNPGELMTSPRLAEMMSVLRTHYDYIILDSAPVGMVSDAFNLTKYVDATIYVVYDKKTRLQDLRFLNDTVEDERLKRVNVVVNGTSSSKGYGYGYN